MEERLAALEKRVRGLAIIGHILSWAVLIHILSGLFR